MKKALVTMALLLTSLTATAVERPAWDNVTVGYIRLGIGANIPALNGQGLLVNKTLGDNWYFSVSYYEADRDWFYVSNLPFAPPQIGEQYFRYYSYSAGVGYRHRLGKNTDIFGTVRYGHAKLKYRLINYSETPITTVSVTPIGSIGFRTMVTPAVELGAQVQAYFNLDEVTWKAQATYYLTDSISGTLAFEDGGKSEDTLGVYASWNF